MTLLTSDFDYTLPPESIAQRPAPRGTSRLLVLDAEADSRHRTVADLPALLGPDDLLVVNDTQVMPARLVGERLPGGGRVELLLLEAEDDDPCRWWTLARPAKRLRVGRALRFPSRDGVAADHDAIEAEVCAIGEQGRVVVRFEEDPRPHLERLGHVPLPPYIQRADDGSDVADYQTVFARHVGAVAAPTAGLHFDDRLLEALDAAGVRRTAVTLHVGIGTFRPVAAEAVDEHAMDEERYRISAAAAEAIALTRRRGGRVVAVGTTVVRTLESAADTAGNVAVGPGRSRLFIRPGYRFRVVDALMTNFHLPRSTLLMLVSAFAGRERVLGAYREAIERGYRFYSYGDAMFTNRSRSAVAEVGRCPGT